MPDSMGRGTRASERTAVSNHLKPSQTRHRTRAPPYQPVPTLPPLCAAPRRYLGMMTSDMERVVDRGLSEARATEHGVSSEVSEYGTRPW